ncbi:MAG: hypothetical protein ABJK37_16565 [Paraglaciecola sp.]|uniref:hypothetical protein n=1 Tax=Paraglaciecola sp. TaxID=1920173 RepID=UPI0032994478
MREQIAGEGIAVFKLDDLWGHILQFVKRIALEQAAVHEARYLQQFGQVWKFGRIKDRVGMQWCVVRLAE